MKKYIVIERFKDKENDLKVYNENEEYPHEGAPFNYSRAKFLVSRGYIKEVRKEEKENGKKI